MPNPRCALCTVKLPLGPVGIAFTESDVNQKPLVMDLDPKSPLADVVSPGFVCYSFTTGDGVTYENLSAIELSDMIKQSSEDPFRKLTFYM